MDFTGLVGLDGKNMAVPNVQEQVVPRNVVESLYQPNSGISWQTPVPKPEVKPPPTPAPAPSNQNTGGRAITEDEALRLGYDWNNLPSGYSRNVPAGPSEADFTRMIDEAYAPQMGYLNEAEGMLRRDYPTIQAELEKQSEANKAQLTANKQKAIAGTEKNVREAKGKKEDALAQARRLFAELQRGSQARFGGTSSAGQAVSEIQGQEMQRQQGATQRDWGKFMQDVQAQQAEIENNYNTQALQLETQKQSALNQANRDFQSKLLEISRLKAETESNKAMRRLQALQDLRNQVFSINQQNTQFQQQLEMMKYNQQLQLEAYNKQLAGQTSPNYIQGTTSFSTAGQTTGANQPTQYSGQIRRLDEPQYIGAIGKSVVGYAPDGRAIYDDNTAGWTYAQR